MAASIEGSVFFEISAVKFGFIIYHTEKKQVAKISIIEKR